jgi:DNA repair protein RadC
LLALRFRLEKYATAFFWLESGELQKNEPDPSSHGSSVQERLVTYGSEALDSAEERQSLTIDSPMAIADLCSEMRFLDRKWLRVVLLNATQQLIKVATVSQGSDNESLAHPREIFKPAIVHSAYSFILVHNL